MEQSRIRIIMTDAEADAVRDAIALLDGHDHVRAWLRLLVTKYDTARSPLRRTYDHAQDAYLAVHEYAPDKDVPEQTEPDWA